MFLNTTLQIVMEDSLLGPPGVTVRKSVVQAVVNESDSVTIQLKKDSAQTASGPA